MTTNKQLFWLGVTLVFGWLIYLLSPVLMPFLVGATLAYMGDPLVDKLETFKLPRTLAVVVVFLVTFILVIGVLLILIPTISAQVQVTFEKAPEAFGWLNQTAIPWLNEHLKLNLSASTDDIQSWLQQHWQDTSAVLQQVLSSIGNSSMVLVAWIGNLMLIPVVAFYLLRDWDKLVAYVGELIPRKQSEVVFQLAKESDEVLGAFVRGQLLVMLALGIIYSLGLWLSGLEVALLVGMIAGAASIVPYLGFAVGIIVASIAALLQFHTMGSLIPIVIVFIVGQALEGMVLTPLLVGDKIGLHPVTVIFAVLAGGQLFGFVGILIALPLAAVIAVIMRHFHRRYRQSEFYDDAKPEKKIVIDKPANKKGQSSA
ncbi:MAG TPA: AI-2E family transporter [Aeromonadales bacterium]|nr:AI-2E family transporter [Aeromonadales bacterium]